jgi:D-beta-D-heptose 7-phosphate kinase / D-beta-D-heptose 1-phosphate adenosyltransferase
MSFKIIHSLRTIQLISEDYKKRSNRVVFTNGCFDVIHRGHIETLEAARRFGDVLIVGVNSDDSIRRIKASLPNRPVNTLDDRLAVLAALECVDYLVPFSEDTPINLVKLIKPHVFVKGGDYTIDMLPEAEFVRMNGGRTKTVPYIPGYSTTNTLARIKEKL